MAPNNPTDGNSTIPSIRTERMGAVLRVTFDNPERRNAIGTEALNGLDRLADRIAEDRGVRAVIVTGAGDRAFTSGFDLRELADFSPEEFMRSHFSHVIEKWARLPVPVIGALNGHCMGGGVHVAVACDIRLSVPGVRFMIPAARFGFVYVPWAIKRIAQTMGTSFAAQLLYLDTELTAEQLTGNGFIHRIVPAEELATAAFDLAEGVAALAPLAVSGMKQLVREEMDEEAVRAAMARCAGSEDVREGLAAMREKRAPKFEGR
ncbi:MAG: enoyl-CoA hydratase-related protein [Paracoccaceae bacterium]|nr:enoyl-CoA hydratase-related protein [Paracoccaceae bacterium]